MRSWLPRLGVLPSIPKARETQHSAVPRTDEIRLLAIRPFKPLIIAAGRNDAPMALERVPEHGLIGNTLGARVEACRQLLQGLFPPPWNEPPAHRYQLVGAVGGWPHGPLPGPSVRCCSGPANCVRGRPGVRTDPGLRATSSVGRIA